MLQRQSTAASLIDVLDRVLDKGIVIDAWVALSVAGINLVTVDARIVVASVETYLRNAESVARILEVPVKPLRS
jgi:gas vesicle structural protein